jgi:hypothetical protein
LEAARDLTGKPYCGLIPIGKFPYTFTQHEKQVMREIVDSVYDMPKLLEFYSQFNASHHYSAASSTAHPVSRQWTAQSLNRLGRLVACLGHADIGMVVQIEEATYGLIEKFVNSHPVYLPPFDYASYVAKIASLKTRASRAKKNFAQTMQEIKMKPLTNDTEFERALKAFIKTSLKWS